MKDRGASAHVFIVCAQSDVVLRDQLTAHLSSLERQGLIAVGHEGHVTAGDDYRHRITQYLEQANLLLLLVSPDFMASDRIWEEELRRAMDRHAQGSCKVVPIVVRPVDIQGSGFERMKHLPRDGKPVTTWPNRDDAWFDVVRGIRELLPAGSKMGRDPLYIHPLPSEADFQGRGQELNSLRERFVQLTPGVIALVGVGGAGKSVLLDRVLTGLLPEMPGLDGLFVWSFNSDPDVDRCLRQAHRYLTGSESSGEGSMGRVYALCETLSRCGRVIVAFDGLEQMQEENGHVRDAALRLLLERIAHGCGTTLALVTSRLPLRYLQRIRPPGYKEILIDQLSPSAAAALLCARGVIGPRTELEDIAERFGCHALTLSLLGTVLSEFYGGNIASVSRVADLGKLASLDQSGRLASVLQDYERLLGADAAALLERLAAFPRGVAAGLLEELFTGPGKEDVAGPLARLDGIGVRALLARLMDLKLLGRRECYGEVIYSAHPAIADYFYRRLLDAGAGQRLHEAVRDYLKGRPLQVFPQTEEEIDHVEQLLYHTLRAGKVTQAASLFVERLDPFHHLGWTLGDYTRGERLCSWFFQEGDLSKPLPGLVSEVHRYLVSALGFFQQRLGDLHPAADCLKIALALDVQTQRWREAGIDMRDLAVICLLQGRLPDAIHYATEGVVMASRANDSEQIANCEATLAVAQGWMGDTRSAKDRFARARDAQRTSDGSDGSDGELYMLRGIHHAAFLAATGDKERALRINRTNFAICEHSPDRTTRCRLLMAEIFRMAGELPTALEHLAPAREFALRSGWQEAICQAHLIAGRIHADAGEPGPAAACAAAGVLIAERCGYLLHQIDLLVLRGETWLALHQTGPAEKDARSAHALAAVPATAYAWGQAEALDLLGRVFLARDRLEDARISLSQALTLRTALLDPRSERTRRALVDIG